MTKIKDPVRKQSVIYQKEEAIRQSWIQKLIALGYPKQYLQVEVHLKKILRDAPIKLPNRRVDILCYFQKEGVYYPLVLIECKAVKIDQTSLDQVMGYNVFVKAPYVAVVSDKQIFFGRWDKEIEDYQFSNHFPSYKELKHQL
ncbi:MAG: hypothetical protein K940chlam8_01257 [Chlamydiae bacterium]|nr:hypothetical protein [Chlamydiota bacterium]